MFQARAKERLTIIRRALTIAGLSAALLAVMLLPMIDAYRFTGRDAAPDLEQRFSQPVSYALINYIIAEPEWRDADILGTSPGFNWFYVGIMPMIGVLFVPLAMTRMPWRRRSIVAAGVLMLALLL